MSNGRYRSVEHRVTANGSSNRISVPIFVNPRPQGIIGPLPEALENGEKPIYKQVLYSDYVKHFFRKAHAGKNTDGNKDGLVNLSEKTCSCMKFQVDKLPCRHALAAIRFAKKPFGDFCGDCYKTTSWVEAYSGNIFPVGHPSEWTIPEGVRSMVVYPPPFRAQAGRPKKKRYKSAGEHRNGNTRHCTICGKSGHSRQNCRNAQPC
ncbi:hypothetical protein LWI29_007171 [Acer saccharum]|uniref:SWIM-type domain-containing protein n=1 Tax=Acer saccharum TaxID=4024 RepID=A0AA39RBT1_ACESA|nr:hypothetical protein LWI29_007171 [Acer saccharum]